MSGTTDQDLPETLLESAARWQVRAVSGDLTRAERAALEAWLRADPRHALAFERVRATSQLFDEIGGAPDILRARRDALDRAQRAARGRWRPLRYRFSALRVAAVAAFVVLGIVFAINLMAPRAAAAVVYTTTAGERRVITLDDGSKISLDEATRVSVRYSQDERSVSLDHGQARFSVAHDAVRRFIVAARDWDVTAVGTEFNIDLVPAGAMAITLIEGRVSVADPQSTDIALAPRVRRAIELMPAEQLWVATGGQVVRQRVDVDAAIAWERGKLIFDDEPLVTALNRVNRYSKRRVIVADSAAAAVRISGVFNTGNLPAFVEGVTASLPVRSTEQADGTVVLHIEN